MLNTLNKVLFIAQSLAFLSCLVLAYALSDIHTVVSFGRDNPLQITISELEKMR